MSLLFIYSLINYYTAFSSVTLKSSLGGASSRGAPRAAGQGVGVCRDTRTLPARGAGGSSRASGCPGSASL